MGATTIGGRTRREDGVDRARRSVVVARAGSAPGARRPGVCGGSAPAGGFLIMPTAFEHLSFVVLSSY